MSLLYLHFCSKRNGLLYSSIIISDPARGTFYPQKLAQASPTSGGLSVGIVRSRTQATEFFYGSTPLAG
jgi:hypothetical protein